MNKPKILISLPIFSFSESLWINLLQYLSFRAFTLYFVYIQNMSKSYRSLLNNFSVIWTLLYSHEQPGFHQSYLQLLQHCSSFSLQMKFVLLLAYGKVTTKIFIAPDLAYAILFSATF